MVTVLGFKGAISLSGFSNGIVRLSGLGLKARLEIRGSLRGRFRVSTKQSGHIGVFWFQ